MTQSITTNDGCQIAYCHWINPGKPTIVLSNSLGTTMSMWVPQLEQFKQQFSVVTYDIRGHGLSSVMPGGYSLDRLGCDLIELLDHLELDKVYFCGLSIGGMMGQWLSVTHPERVHALVLANTSASVAPASMWGERLAIIERDGLQSIWQLVLSRWVSPTFAEQQPDQVVQLRDMFRAIQDQGYAGCCAAVRDMNMRNVAKLNTLPTLLIAGSKDQATSVAQSEYLLSQYSNGQLCVLDAGHLSNIEQPNDFTESVLTFFSN